MAKREVTLTRWSTESAVFASKSMAPMREKLQMQKPTVLPYAPGSGNACNRSRCRTHASASAYAGTRTSLPQEAAPEHQCPGYGRGMKRAELHDDSKRSTRFSNCRWWGAWDAGAGRKRYPMYDDDGACGVKLQAAVGPISPPCWYRCRNSLPRGGGFCCLFWTCGSSTATPRQRLRW